MQSVIMVVQ